MDTKYVKSRIKDLLRKLLLSALIADPALGLFSPKLTLEQELSGLSTRRGSGPHHARARMRFQIGFSGQWVANAGEWVPTTQPGPTLDRGSGGLTMVILKLELKRVVGTI